MKKTVVFVARMVAASTAAVLFTGATAYAQDVSSLMTAKPDANGGKSNATSIPMSTYSFAATKGSSKKPYTGTLAGTSPFASSLSGSTIPVVVVPVVVNINGTVFDPTVPNYCGSEAGVSAITRIMQSPVVVPSSLTFNGVGVGDVQYVNGFMRAEFWQTINGSPAYTNEFSFSVALPVTITAGANGVTYNSGCQLLGVLNESFVQNQILTLLQSLTGVSPSEIVLFVTNNISISPASPPVPPGSALGYHAVTGSAPQVYAVADYNTTGLLKARDVTVVSHELAEIMNDPLGRNATPAWGGVGEVPAGSCQSNLEVADPLVGTQVAISQNGYTYNLVELAYFSWFFNAQTTLCSAQVAPLPRTGLSSGPSTARPPGGTLLTGEDGKSGESPSTNLSSILAVKALKLGCHLLLGATHMNMNKDMKKTVVFVALIAGQVTLFVQAQKNDRPEVLPEAAKQKATLEGDPKGAIKQYKDIATRFASNHAVAAAARSNGGC